MTTETKTAVVDRAKKILVEHLGVEIEKITDDAHLYDDLGADSLDAIELTMAFEEEFGIEILDEEMEQSNTFGKIVALLEKSNA